MVDLIKVACFVKKQIMLAISKAANLSELVEGSSLYWAFFSNNIHNKTAKHWVENSTNTTLRSSPFIYFVPLTVSYSAIWGALKQAHISYAEAKLCNVSSLTLKKDMTLVLIFHWAQYVFHLCRKKTFCKEYSRLRDFIMICNDCEYKRLLAKIWVMVSNTM